MDILKIEIDLREELNIRSDLISVGNIKKERKQQVPDIFLNAFREAYNQYIEYLKGKKFEKDYGAFTVNKQGKAMTYFSYRKKFQEIIQSEIIPMYLASEKPELVLYGRILMENKLSPHIFRHWYTVQLVLSGISEPGVLMYWRGDSSPESSLTYLQNKGELEKQYRKVNNEVFDYLLWASKMNND
jgi:integrase